MSKAGPMPAGDEPGVAMLVGLREDVTVRFDVDAATVGLFHHGGETMLGDASIALVTALELLTLGPVMARNLVESIRSQVDPDQAAADVTRWTQWDAELAPLLVHTVARNGRGLAHAVPKPGGGTGFAGMAGPVALPRGAHLGRTDASIVQLRSGRKLGVEVAEGAYEVWGVDHKMASILQHLTTTDPARVDDVWAHESVELSPTLGGCLARLLVLAGVLGPVGANGEDGTTT